MTCHVRIAASWNAVSVPKMMLQILDHILEAHKPSLTAAYCEDASNEALLSLYSAALTWKC